MIVGERCLLKGLIPASALWVSTNSPLSQSKSSRPSKWHGTSDLKRVYFVMFLLSLLGWLSLCYRENNHETLYFWKWRNIVLFLLKKVILWWITSVTVQMLCIGSTKDKYVWNCNPILLFSWTPGSSKTAIRHPQGCDFVHYTLFYINVSKMYIIYIIFDFCTLYIIFVKHVHYFINYTLFFKFLCKTRCAGS